MFRIALVITLAASAGIESGHAAAAPAQQQTGVVTGVVRGTRAPARRTAERYAGAMPAPARDVQDLAAVVYLKSGQGRAAAKPARPRLMQKDTLFVPGALIVPVGTSVAFPNGDPFFHNVFSYSKPKRFDLGRYPQGETKTVLFDRPGIVRIYCEVHSSMRALVVVTDSPWYATVDPDGRFTIPDVPPGRYEVVIIDADLGTVTRSITVAAGETTHVAAAFDS